SNDPATAPKGWGYFITWADGRAKVAYRQKQDTIDFIRQDNDDPDGMDVVEVKYRAAEKGERVRNKFTQASARTYMRMKTAWDNPPRDDATYPGSNVSGPVPHQMPKHPGDLPRRDQRTKDDYHAPSQLDRDPIPGDTQPEDGTGGQVHSGEPGRVDNIYPEPLNWLRPLKGLPFTDEHLVHDFNEDFLSEYHQRQRGLNMRKRKVMALRRTLNMKKQSDDLSDEINKVVAQWQQTAEAIGVDEVLAIFADRANGYNTVMRDLKNKYPTEVANMIAVGVVNAIPQVLRGSNLNMRKGAATNPKYDYGSVQTSNISEVLVSAIKDIQDDIDKDKLYDGEDEPGWVENGLQKLFHITVLFGVRDNIKDTIQQVFDKHRPVQIATNRIHYFSSDPNYDVAVVRCESKELTKIHDELKNKLENQETYPDYKPHVTIAYLKKGERLDDNAQVGNISWEIDSMDLSTSDGKLEKISALAIPIRESLDYSHSWNKKKKEEKGRKDVRKKEKEEVVSEKEKKILQMDFNKLNLKKRAHKRASILDEPRASLDSAIWDIGADDLPMLKPDIKLHIIENFLAYVSKYGGYIKPEQFVKNMFYTGSTATYTYNDASDIDIHVIVDWIDLAALNPDKAKKDPNEMWRELHDVFWWTLNKVKLPGTKHPLTYYVMPPGDEKKLVDQKEELYDMGHDVWLVPPGKAVNLTEEVIDPALEEAAEFMARINQHIADARKGVIDYALLNEVITPENAADRYAQIADKLDEIDTNLKALKQEYAELKQKRKDAFDSNDSLVEGNSNYSLGNIIFKLVERYKYMDVLRKIKQITDDVDLRPDQVTEVADALGLDFKEE
ncbi:MAG: 2'-5' RNA ligase family protein, partial [Candidatus Baldrarchaeia archaeon]